MMERIPILKMGRFLLVTIQVDMHDRLAMNLQDDLTAKISQTSARGVLIDISALDMVDSFIGRMIANIAAMSRVLDAQTVVVGMQPSVAITLVELGLSLEGVRTALNVDRGITLLHGLLASEDQFHSDSEHEEETATSHLINGLVAQAEGLSGRNSQD
jgi:rsbT antagonist protein RsbS